MNNTELSAQLFSYEGDAKPEQSSEWVVSYLRGRGVSSNKIVLTVTTKALHYELTSEKNGLNAPVRSESFPGWSSYPAICGYVNINKVWNNLKVVHDKSVGTYAYHNTHWVSYFDAEDAYNLGKYIAQNNLGGGSISSITHDDVNNECGCGHMPLLNGLVQGLRNVTIGKVENCT